MARPERSIIIIGGLVLVLVAAAILVTLAFGSDEPASFPEGSPERALQDYLAAIDAGDIDRAYNLLSTNVQTVSGKPGGVGMTRDDFARMVSGSRDTRNRRVRIDDVEGSADGRSATITLEIEYFSGSGLDFNRSSWTRTVHMVREDDGWKIDEPYFYAATLTGPARVTVG